MLLFFFCIFVPSFLLKKLWLKYCSIIIALTSSSAASSSSCKNFDILYHLFHYMGWSGGAEVLGNLPVPGRSTNLDYSRARAYCACSRSGWGLFGHFFSHLSLSGRRPDID